MKRKWKEDQDEELVSWIFLNTLDFFVMLRKARLERSLTLRLFFSYEKEKNKERKIKLKL